MSDHEHSSTQLSLLADLNCTIIYSGLLLLLGRSAARFLPTLRATPFSDGVRFRCASAWIELFAETGRPTQVRGPAQPLSLALRLQLIQSCRRDSFLPVPR